MIAELTAIIAPVFLCAALGFGWARHGKPFDTGLVASLVMNIGTPCLIVSTFLKTRPDAAAFAQMATACAVVFVGFGLLGTAVLLLGRQRLADFLPSLMFPNAGNMGLPLSLFAFGDEGLAFAIVFFAWAQLLNVLFGLTVMAGGVRLRELWRSPLIYAIALALLVMAGDVELPGWFANTVALLGGLAIPLMLIALGVSLSRLSVSSLRRSLVLSLVRLGGGFVIAWLVAEGFGLEGTARGVLILQSSLPVAVINYLFAERYRRASAEVAGMVVISTAISFVTLPALLLYLLQTS